MLEKSSLGGLSHQTQFPSERRNFEASDCLHFHISQNVVVVVVVVVVVMIPACKAGMISAAKAICKTQTFRKLKTTLKGCIATNQEHLPFPPHIGVGHTQILYYIGLHSLFPFSVDWKQIEYSSFLFSRLKET